MRNQGIQQPGEIRPSTIIGAVAVLMATAITGWIMMQTIGDNQAAPNLEPLTSTTVIDDDLATSIAGERAERRGTDRPELDGSDVARLDDQDGGSTPTTQPTAPPNEPTPPPNEPAPPKKTPETTPPPPPNEPPTVDELVLGSEGGQLMVRAAVTDPEAELATINVVVAEGNRIIATKSVDPQPDVRSQKFNAGFVIDTTGKPRQRIAVTVVVIDGAGAKADQSAEHEVVRRTMVVVSPVSMSLNSKCFDKPSKVALALSGDLVAAGIGIDHKTALSGEFRDDKRSTILSDEQVGYVDGGKDWFLLVTVTPDLTTVNGELISLGKIQTLHTVDGSFTKVFDRNGCSGAISYAITTSVV